MIEFIGGEEKLVDVGDPVFEEKTKRDLIDRQEGERTSNSIVYRKDVVEALYQALRTQLQERFTDSMSLAISMANALPSAEKMGIWLSEPRYLGDAYKGYWRCSECQTYLKLKTKYCPNCGAKMEDE